MGMSATKFQCKSGDKIRITGSALQRDTEACLLSAKEMGLFRREITFAARHASTQVTHITKLRESHLTEIWQIPSDGDWYVAHDDSEVTLKSALIRH
jgi:hypothetical protein